MGDENENVLAHVGIPMARGTLRPCHGGRVGEAGPCR